MKRHYQKGFGAIVAIVVLVILASLSAAMLRFGSVQQLTSAQDVQSARAWAAAKAGTEWGLSLALQSPWCDGGAAVQPNLNLSAATGFNVNVVCASTLYNEGESSPGTARTVRVFTITATACNSAVSCPNAAAATSAGYIERQRQVIATR